MVNYHKQIIYTLNVRLNFVNKIKNSYTSHYEKRETSRTIYRAGR